MKKILLFCLAICCSALLWAQIPPQPDPPRLVNDYVGVLTNEQVNELEHRLVAFKDSTSNVICVVIVSDLGDYTAAEFAYEIGDKWGVRDKNHENGLVILIKPSSSRGGDGDIFIATGYDLEGVLPDAACNHIIEQQFIPELKQGNYYEAIVKGLDVILPAVAGEINVARNNNEDDAPLAGFVFFLLIMIIILIVSASRSSHNRKGGNGSDNGSKNDEDLLNAIFWGSILSGNHRGGSGFSGSSGFGGGFGSGGGFGGFGGSGGFGGGGAGGRF